MIDTVMEDKNLLKLDCDPQAWSCLSGKIPVLLIAINMPGYYSLPVRILSLMASEDASVSRRYDVRYIEQDNNQDHEKLLECLRVWRPEIVGLSLNIWNQQASISLAKCLKELLPDTTILCGGQEISGSVVDYLELVPQFDYLIDGEGELPFGEFLGAWQRGEGLVDPEKVSGLLYRRGGKTHLTRPAEVVGDLGEIPSVILAGMAPVTGQSMLGAMIEGSRGCPYKCSFCFEGYKQCKVRTNSTQRIVDEIRYMADRGSSYFHLLDPILLNGDNQRLALIAQAFDELKQRDVHSVVSVEAYAERITEENVKYLESLSIIDLGLQTTNPRTTKEIHRHYQPDKFRRGVELLRDTQATFNLYLISGLPYETPASFLEGILFTVNQRPTRVFFNELLLLNGTELRARAEEYGYDFDPQAPYTVYANRWMTRRLLKIIQLAANITEKRYNLSFKSLFLHTPWSAGVEYAVPRAAVRLDTACGDWSGNQKKLQDVLKQVPQELEVICDDGLQIDDLMKIVGPVHLAGVNRLRLTMPCSMDISPEILMRLVSYGLLHFKVFVQSDGNLESDPLALKCLDTLTGTYKLKGHATIRPFTEVVISPADGDMAGFVQTLRQVAARRPYLITVANDSQLTNPKWRTMLIEEFDHALENGYWLKLPADIMRRVLADMDELDKVIKSLDKLGLISEEA